MKDDSSITISPSRFADALACPGRARGQSPTRGHSDLAPQESPSARLGKLCHRAFELCVSNFDKSFESAWEEATHWQRDEAAAAGDLDQFERAYDEPSLHLYALRLQRAVHRLLEHLPPGAEPHAEVWLTSSDGVLEGRADLIVRGGQHWLADLKTGAVLDRETGKPRADYVHQLQLYAYMEAETVGSWPTHGMLISLHGRDQRIDFDPSDCVALAQQAADLARGLASGLDLLTPSQDGCRWCHRITTCPAPWEGDDVWTDVTAMKLIVTDVHRQGREVWFEGLPSQGDGELVVVRRIDETIHPATEDLAPGSTAVLIGPTWSEYAQAWHLGRGGRLEVTGETSQGE